MEGLIDLHRGYTSRTEQGLVQAEVLLLADQVRLQVADVLDLQEKAQVAGAPLRGQADVELLAEAGEITHGIEDVALGLG